MIRLQDIADMAGVSRTTVSNVINGNTKRVSQKTIDKITAILKEQNYVPNMGSMMLSGISPLEKMLAIDTYWESLDFRFSLSPSPVTNSTLPLQESTTLKNPSTSVIF